jgi:hypothetical protein
LETLQDRPVIDFMHPVVALRLPPTIVYDPFGMKMLLSVTRKGSGFHR